MQRSSSRANGPAQSAAWPRRASGRLALGIAIGWYGGAAAQDVDTVRIGTRVKVTGMTFAPLVGEVHSLSPDTLFVASPDGMVSPMPWSAVSRLQVSVGKRRNTRRGAVLGFTAAGIASVVVAIAGDASERDGATDWEAFLVLAGVSCLPSAGIGALIGRVVWSERWREVSITGVRPSVVALPGGRLGVGVRYRH